MKPALSAAMLLVGLAAATVRAQAPQSPEMHIELSKSSVLLGEPVWVDVSLTNHSSQTMLIGWGHDCPTFNERPIVVEMLAATQGNGEPKNCGGMAGNCTEGWAPPLLPGATTRQRYVLAGDFRITAPGHYDVRITERISWQPAPPGAAGPPPFKGWIGLTQTPTLQLNVLPPDPAELLALEQQLAAEAALPFTTPQRAVTFTGDHEAYMTAVRAAMDENRAWRDEHSKRSYSLYAGLAAFPAAGMEPVFESWQTPPRQIGYGVTALYHLNTPEARQALARLATLPVPATNDKYSVNATRFGAADSLSRMGDHAYLPLLEQLTTDPSRDVRMLAILGVGRLGGARELPFLQHIVVTTAQGEDRRSALQAMANTASAAAVPLLMEAFTSPHASDDPGYWLMSLTHHQLPALGSTPARQRTPLELQAAWRAWWSAHHATAKTYGPNDCTDRFDQ